jgi:ketol-acid reductoisomerase
LMGACFFGCATRSGATLAKEIVMAKVYHDNDVDIKPIVSKTVGICGYGSQGHAQAQNLRDSGVKVIVAELPGTENYRKAVEHGFKPMSAADVTKQADVIQVLLPDEIQRIVYAKEIAPNLVAGKTLAFSHGFNIHFKQIVPPADVDVIMVAPKSPATEERKAFLEGFGVPGLVAVKQNASGKARDVVMAMAKAMRFTRAGVLECTFEQETYEDLFGEQNVLCGGMVDLMKYGFEVLTEAGYPPEMAYFEVVHEVKLIVDLIFEGGIQRMNSVISNTAEWGEYVNGPRIIDPSVKERMKQSLKDIESGKFAKEWMEEAKKGCPNLLAKRKALGEHPVEITGNRVRSLFEKKK